MSGVGLITGQQFFHRQPLSFVRREQSALQSADDAGGHAVRTEEQVPAGHETGLIDDHAQGIVDAAQVRTQTVVIIGGILAEVGLHGEHDAQLLGGLSLLQGDKLAVLQAQLRFQPLGFELRFQLLINAQSLSHRQITDGVHGQLGQQAEAEAHALGQLFVAVDQHRIAVASEAGAYGRGARSQRAVIEQL